MESSLSVGLWRFGALKQQRISDRSCNSFGCTRKQALEFGLNHPSGEVPFSTHSES